MRFAREVDCGVPPLWLYGVDSGTPSIIYNLSFSFTQIIRFFSLLLISCFEPNISLALIIYKIQIIASYFLFCIGMFFVGQSLYKSQLSATYLFTACLYSGLFLQSIHSDQNIIIIFWAPWIALCLIQAHKKIKKCSYNLICASFLIMLQALDQSPQFVIIAFSIAIFVYTIIFPKKILNIIILNKIGAFISIIPIILTILQLIIISDRIDGYVPSLRPSLILSPSQFGETGFLQPTAAISLFMPSTAIVAHPTLTNSMVSLLQQFDIGGSKMLYRLDIAMIGIGAVSVMLSLAMLIGRGSLRAKFGWGSFTLLIAAIALQQTKIYYLLFHIPSFELFRSYLLVFLFATFSLLIISGFGFDRVITQPLRIGRSTFNAGARFFIFGVAICFAFVILLIHLQSPVTPALGNAFTFAVLSDVLPVAVIGALLAWKFERPRTLGVLVIALMIISQADYQNRVWSTLGLSGTVVLDRLGVTEKANLWEGPDGTRDACSTYAGCYLAPGAQTSVVNTGRNAPFLRAASEPALRADLDVDARAALQRIDLPIVWLSREVEAVDSDHKTVSKLNLFAEEADELLRRKTFIHRSDAAKLKSIPTALDNSNFKSRIISTDIKKDKTIVNINALRPVVLNLAVTYDTRWRAYVNGEQVPIMRANLGALAIAIPRGKHNIEVVYHDIGGKFIFFIRLFVGFAMTSLAVFIIGRSFRRGFFQYVPTVRNAAVKRGGAFSRVLATRFRQLRHPANARQGVPEIATHLPSPHRRGIVAALVFIFLALTTIEGWRHGADETLPGPMTRHRDATAIAISMLFFDNWLGFSALRSVVNALNRGGLAIHSEDASIAGVDSYFDALRDPNVVNAAFASAVAVAESAPENITDDDLYFIFNDDFGLSIFYALAFKIFGVSVSSLFYFYMLVFTCSILCFFICHRNDHYAILLMFLWMLAHICMIRVISGLPLDVHTIHGNRFLAFLSITSLFHLAWLICRNHAITVVGVLGAVVQILILLLAIASRSSVLWQLIALLGITSTYFTFWMMRRHRARRRPILWPIAMVMIFFVGWQLSQTPLLHAHYTSEKAVRSHVIWHPLVNALHNNPQREDIFGIPKSIPVWDDAIVYRVFEEEVIKRGGQIEEYIVGDRDWKFRTSERRWDYDWAKYELVLRDYFFKSLFDHPYYAAQSFFVYQPISLLQNTISKYYWKIDLIKDPIIIIPFILILLLWFRVFYKSQLFIRRVAPIIAISVGSACLPVLIVAATTLRLADVVGLLFIPVILCIYVMLAHAISILWKKRASIWP